MHTRGSLPQPGSKGEEKLNSLFTAPSLVDSEQNHRFEMHFLRGIRAAKGSVSLFSKAGPFLRTAFSEALCDAETHLTGFMGVCKKVGR